jgi:hypothetical protein
MATHQNRSARTVEGIVSAQCREDRHHQDKTRGGGDGKSGGIVKSLLDAAAHLGR